MGKGEHQTRRLPSDKGLAWANDALHSSGINSIPQATNSSIDRSLLPITTKFFNHLLHLIRT